MKVGIIRCDEHSNSCAGYGCFPAIQNKTGQFEEYDSVELVGFDTCGGCGRGKADKVVERGQRLKDKGAETIHLGNCLAGACPFKDVYAEALREKVGVPVVEGTHPGPKPQK